MSRRAFAGIWLLLLAAWFATGWVRPLLEPDEGRYAEIPREMWASGDWVTPRLNGLLYFEKPPLQYWATAAAYTLFGVHELSARLWALLVSFFALPLAWWSARRLYNSAEAGLAAVVALAVSPYFALVGQINALDGAFGTLLAGAVLALVAGQGEADPVRRRPLLLGAWLLLALAVLSKGIVAPVLAGGTLVLYSLLARDLSPWRRMQWLPGIALFLAVTAPWFWLMGQRHPDFLYFFFVHEHFARFLTTVHDRYEPWWYFGPIALIALLPWLVLLPRAARAALSRPAAGGTGFRPGLFLLLWLGVVVLFFSLSDSKLATYLTPCLPVAAVLLGGALRERPAAARIAALTTLGLVVLLAVALGFAAEHRGGEAPVPTELLLWCGVAIVAAAVGAWLSRRLSLGAAGAPAGGVALAAGALLAWQSLLFAYTELPPLRTAKPLAELARPLVGPGTRVYMVSQYRQTVPFYLGRTVTLAVFTGELQFGLERAGGHPLPTLGDFVADWRRQADAVAFVDPKAYRELAAQGLPGRVVGEDGRSVLLVRQ